MKAKILKSPGYSFRHEIIGKTYEVKRVDKDNNDVYLIIDHPHDQPLQYEAGTVWRFPLEGVEFVDWFTGQTEFVELAPITEEVEMQKFKVGDKVFLRPESKWAAYGVNTEESSNPLNVVGEITRYSEDDLKNDGLGITVDWNNGYLNSYAEEDLVLVSQQDKTSAEKTSKQPKQKPKRREQTVVYFVFADGKDYEQRRAKSVVINAEDKAIHVDSERNLGKGLVVRENSTVPFSLLEAVRVSTPDGEFCYYFRNGELTGSARQFNPKLPFKTQMH